MIINGKIKKFMSNSSLTALDVIDGFVKFNGLLSIKQKRPDFRQTFYMN